MHGRRLIPPAQTPWAAAGRGHPFTDEETTKLSRSQCLAGGLDAHSGRASPVQSGYTHVHSLSFNHNCCVFFGGPGTDTVCSPFWWGETLTQKQTWHVTSVAIGTTERTGRPRNWGGGDTMWDGSQGRTLYALGGLGPSLTISLLHSTSPPESPNFGRA